MYFLNTVLTTKNDICRIIEERFKYYISTNWG